MRRGGGPHREEKPVTEISHKVVFSCTQKVHFSAKSKDYVSDCPPWQVQAPIVSWMPPSAAASSANCSYFTVNTALALVSDLDLDMTAWPSVAGIAHSGQMLT